MQNDDNACIRYLMKEMDPSEEVLMERAMMEDEDLLIEVESMRQTFNRLNNLPHLEPPKEITESIINEAAQRQSSTRSEPAFIPLAKYAAAAAVLISGFVIGGLFIDGLMDTGKSGDATESSDSEMRSSSVSVPSYSITNVSQNDVEPWIDRNNVIYFQDRFSRQNQAAFDSIMNRTTQKLKPLNDTFMFQRNPRTLKLTGSGN